jgi:predicted nucleotidyltransferase
MPSKFLPLPVNTVERLKELPPRVAALEGLIALWLFGSLARDAWTPISDVDLAYLACEELQDEALDRFEARLYSTIASTLHTDDISLVHLRFAPVYLAWRVLTEGRLLWCSDKSAVATVAEAVYRLAPDIHWLRHAGNVDFLKGRGMSDPAIDRDRVIEFLRLMSADVQDLRQKAKTSKEEYL